MTISDWDQVCWDMTHCKKGGI